MKRFTIVLMICALMVSLLFSACDSADDIDGDVGMANTVGQNDITIEYNATVAESYDEYQSLILQLQLPGEFDHFENFAYFGEFKRFIIYPMQSIDNYLYGIVDQAQIELLLHINNKDKWPALEKLSDTDINPVDMRTLPSKQRGEYEVNGLTYHYAMGELLYISWWRDGKYYELSPEIKGDYPIEASTVFAKLLNIQGEDYPLMCWLLVGNKAS